MDRVLGTISFVSRKGFAFVADENDATYFLHISSIRPTSNGARILPRVGDTVYFSVRESSRKPGTAEAFDVEFVKHILGKPSEISIEKSAAMQGAAEGEPRQ